MRLVIASGLFLILPLGLLATKKVISPITSASNDQVDIVATITLAEDEVAQKLGADPGKGIVLLEVRITPKTDHPVLVSPDDFILFAHDDGERAKPFEPAEIAGAGALVVTNSTDTTKVKKTSSSIGFGGITGGGSSPGMPAPTKVSSKLDTKSEGNATLLEVLKAKQFPSKESIEPVEGLLYFPLDGKHKLRNLAVLYRGPAGKLDLEFEH